jgi:hypothetical protein
MGIAAQPLTCYVVEWYRPGLDEDQLSGIVAEVERSSRLVRVDGSSVRCVLTLAVPTDEVVFGIFVADSPDVVALLCRRAGMPASRLTSAVADRDLSHGYRETPDSISDIAQ